MVKKNGKGKQYFYYDKGEILSEVEYLNGKINVKVKVYHKNGIMRLEGDYLKWNNFCIMIEGKLY